MGSSISKEFIENTRRNEEFQDELQRTQLERQAIMQALIRERASAMDLARSRDLIYYFGAFAAITAAICAVIAIRKKEPLYLVPMSLPLAFFEYNYKILFRDQTFKQRESAEKLLSERSALFDLPNGPITIEEIDSRSKRQGRYR